MTVLKSVLAGIWTHACLRRSFSLLKRIQSFATDENVCSAYKMLEESFLVSRATALRVTENSAIEQDFILLIIEYRCRETTETLLICLSRVSFSVNILLISLSGKYSQNLILKPWQHAIRIEDRFFMTAMFKGRNNTIFLQDKKFYSPKEEVCIVLPSNMDCREQPL